MFRVLKTGYDQVYSLSNIFIIWQFSSYSRPGLGDMRSLAHVNKEIVTAIVIDSLIILLYDH